MSELIEKARQMYAASQANDQRVPSVPELMAAFAAEVEKQNLAEIERLKQQQQREYESYQTAIQDWYGKTQALDAELAVARAGIERLKAERALLEVKDEQQRI